MTKNTVWFYQDEHLLAYNRAKDGNIKNNDMLLGTCNSDIRDMIYCNGVIITAHQ